MSVLALEKQLENMSQKHFFSWTDIVIYRSPQQAPLCELQLILTLLPAATTYLLNASTRVSQLVKCHVSYKLERGKQWHFRQSSRGLTELKEEKVCHIRLLTRLAVEQIPTIIPLTQNW